MSVRERTRVSVVIPTRDRAALLAGALRSVQALARDDLELEILVVDNGSTDDTPQVVRAAGAKLLLCDTPGAAAARNTGMRAATSPYIAFLDDDDEWLPGHLRPHLALLETDPTLAGVVGRIQNCDHELRRAGEPWPEKLPTDGDLFESFLQAYPQIGATVVRASVRETVGYFDEELFGDEDWDWHLRLALQERVGFVDVPCVLFRQRPPGAYETLQWKRRPYMRRVFLRNVRRAGWRRLRPFMLLAYLRMRASYFAYFTQSSLAHLEAGDIARARRSLFRAARSAPFRATVELIRPGGRFQRAVRAVLWPSKRAMLSIAGVFWLAPIIELVLG
ncbi:MAG: glycosyltransferase family 2 protein [Hyphomicrobiales bacterium]